MVGRDKPGMMENSTGFDLDHSKKYDKKKYGSKYSFEVSSQNTAMIPSLYVCMYTVYKNRNVYKYVYK